MAPQATTTPGVWGLAKPPHCTVAYRAQSPRAVGWGRGSGFVTPNPRSAFCAPPDPSFRMILLSPWRLP